MKIYSILIFCFIRFTHRTNAAVSNATLGRSTDFFDSYNNPSPIEEVPEICDQYKSETCAKRWLEEAQKVHIRNLNRLENAEFKKTGDLNEVNKLNQLSIKDRFSKYKIDLGVKAGKFDWRSFNNTTIKRIFQIIDNSVLYKDFEIAQKVNHITEKMVSIHRNKSGKLVPSNKTDLYDKKMTDWKNDHDSIGPKVRKYFIERRNLQNIAAKKRGFNDAQQFLIWGEYEETNLNETAMKLFNEVFPFYQQIHALLRHCLWQQYPNRFEKDGLIPISILLVSFSSVKKCIGLNRTDNITPKVDKAFTNMTVEDMVKVPEQFFESIGMFKMVDNFWNRSMFTKPKNKTVACNPKTGDFYIGNDFRLSMCANKKSYKNLHIMHHEMGHLQYFMAYKDLPIFLRHAANPGFHEGTGHAIELSSKTPEYLKEIGLIEEIPESKEFDIEFLMKIAMRDILYIPYTLTFTVFNWGVFNGSVPDDKLNEYWWNINEKFFGVKPPIKRSENNFDIANQFHINQDISIMPYYFSIFYTYTFYESLCKEAGEYNDFNSSKPLHRCNFYKSMKAGKKLLDMMKNGKKQHWTKTMEMMTGPLKAGENTSLAKSLMKYFKPLYDWIRIKNKELNIKVGW